jgi:pyruvate formate lyase activating enzyme
MLLGGLLPLTLVDFPGRLACVVFTQGCNLRCGYCHNPQLIDVRASTSSATPTESRVLEFLNTRRGLLDGVVVSGGEPTLQPDLIPLLIRIKNLGFLVKLDTNGTNPPVLREALDLGLLDHVAMDVKHDPSRYAEITGAPVDPDILVASRDLLLSSGVACEFRTTVVPQFHDEAAIEEIARFCTEASHFFLQRFCPDGAFEKSLRTGPAPTIDLLRQFKHIAERFVVNVELR